MYHLDPVIDADRAIDAMEHDRIEADLEQKLKAFKCKRFALAMRNAIKENPSSLLPIHGHSWRPAIDIIFSDATEETHRMIVDLLSDGAEGRDVTVRCKDLIDHIATNYSDYAGISGVIAS